MTDRYPKSREELEIQIEQLQTKLEWNDRLLKIAADDIRLKDETIAALRRKKPPHKLDKDAVDAFQRPAFSR